MLKDQTVREISDNRGDVIGYDQYGNIVKILYTSGAKEFNYYTDDGKYIIRTEFISEKGYREIENFNVSHYYEEEKLQDSSMG